MKINAITLRCILCILIGIIAEFSFGQVTPPGLADGDAAWMAVGLKQRLSNKKWSSKTVVGLARIGGEKTKNPFYRNGMFVLNQDFTNKFSKKWSYGFGLSYRRRNLYRNTLSFQPANPSIEQEFRLNGKIAYAYSTNRIKLSPSLKEEVRKFYTPSFDEFVKRIEFRTRFRITLTASLNKKKTHQLILISEQLFPVTQFSPSGEWTKLLYDESRFSLFYRFAPKTLPVAFELGYTNRLIGSKKAYSDHYFTFDIMINNPFGE